MIVIRYESFEKLDEVKKLGILNAGFKVFGANGYKKASVEEIIREANISKGSLFYYFESKKNFFLYLYEYSGQQMEKLVDHPGANGLPSYLAYTDFFERITAIQHIKMKHEKDFPYLYTFMKKAVFETEPSIRKFIEDINQRYITERVKAFFQNIEYNKFKDGIDPKMVMQLLSWCSEGCANLLLAKERMKPSSTREIPDFHEVFALYQSYVTLLRNNFYKEDYL